MQDAPDFYNGDTLAALLVNEPFWLSLEEIANLTDRQIFHLYFHKRDKHGKIEISNRSGRRVDKEAMAKLTPEQQEERTVKMLFDMGIPLEKIKNEAIREKVNARRAIAGNKSKVKRKSR